FVRRFTKRDNTAYPFSLNKFPTGIVADAKAAYICTGGGDPDMGTTPEVWSVPASGTGSATLLYQGTKTKPIWGMTVDTLFAYFTEQSVNPSNSSPETVIQRVPLTGTGIPFTLGTEDRMPTFTHMELASNLVYYSMEDVN